MWEAMVAEMRAERAEADSQRHFTKPNKQIELVRPHLSLWTELREPEPIEQITARSSNALRQMANDEDMFEVG